MIYFLKEKKSEGRRGERVISILFCYKRLLTVPIMPKEVAINNKR